MVDSTEYFDYRRDTQILNREVYHFERSDMPLLINIIKDLHPSINFSNFAQISELFHQELEIEVSVDELERYFSPSIEGIQDEYKYKLNMYEE